MARSLTRLAAPAAPAVVEESERAQESGLAESREAARAQEPTLEVWQEAVDSQAAPGKLAEAVRQEPTHRLAGRAAQRAEVVLEERPDSTRRWMATALEVAASRVQMVPLELAVVPAAQRMSSFWVPCA